MRHFLLISSREDHLKAVEGAQYHFSHNDQLVARLNCLEVVVAKNLRYDHLHLHHGKLLADAVSRTRREGNEGVGMTAVDVLGKEALGQKAFRLRVGGRVSVKDVRKDAHRCSLRYQVVVCIKCKLNKKN